MEKSRKKNVGKSNPILGLLKGILAFFFVSISLFHVFFNSKPEGLNINNKKYNKVIKSRDNAQQKHLEDLRLGIISPEEYYHLATNLIVESNNSKKLLNAERRSLIDGFSFNGRSSFHFWVFVFGLVTALFYFACKSLFDELSRGSTFKHQLVSISGIIVASFWFVHLLFFTQKDFAKNTYFFTILGVAALFSVFTYFLLKYYTYKDLIIIRLLAFIKRVDDKYFVDITAKAIYAEEEGKPLNKDVKIKDILRNYDEDLVETVKGI